MKFFLYAVSPEENTYVAPHAAVFEGDEPPTELTLQQMGAAYIYGLMHKHREDAKQTLASLNENLLNDFLLKEGVNFSHGVWIAQPLQERMDFMASEMEEFPPINDSDAYAFGALWANTLKKYAYRGQMHPFPTLAD